MNPPEDPAPEAPTDRPETATETSHPPQGPGPGLDPEADPTTMHRGCGTIGLAGVALCLLVAGFQTYRFAQYPRSVPPAHLVLSRDLVEAATRLHLRRGEAVPGSELPAKLSEYGKAFPGLSFQPRLPPGWPGKHTLIEAAYHPDLGAGALHLRWGIEGQRPRSLFLIAPPPGLEGIRPMAMTRAGLQVQLVPTPGQIELLVEIP